MPGFSDKISYRQTADTNPGTAYLDRKFVDYSNLYVSNLGENVTSQELHDEFAQFGPIVSAQVMRDQDTGKSLGYGFVYYGSQESARLAREKMDGVKFRNDTVIYVRYHSKGRTTYRFKILLSEIRTGRDFMSKHFDTWEKCVCETFQFLYRKALSWGAVDLESKLFELMKYTYIYDNQERPEFSPRHIRLLYQWFGKTGVPGVPAWSMKKILDIINTCSQKVEIIPDFSALEKGSRTPRSDLVIRNKSYMVWDKTYPYKKFQQKDAEQDKNSGHYYMRHARSNCLAEIPGRGLLGNA